jgi:4-amino-4-deoxy-L-arabinose transferase-like glycosyltransferase
VNAPLSRPPGPFPEAPRGQPAVAPAETKKHLLFRLARERRIATLAWTAALGASFVLIALVRFTSGDPDSTVYAGISARLAGEPFGRWIAPEWWGYWGFTGPFREHPIGILVLPALAGRLGYPALQAAYAVNGLFQVASIVLVQLIAVRLVRSREARALGWIVQLMPIAFVFRVRANQEYAVLAGVLLAVLATERSRRRPVWAAATALAFAWALLVKGILGFVVPIACGVWLAAAAWLDHTRDPVEPVQPRWRAAPWIALALVLLVAPILTVGYEWAYRAATGDSFLSFYTGPRLRPEAVAGGALRRVGYNMVWYMGRLAWYAFPWSIVGLAAWGAWLARARRARRIATTGRNGGAVHGRGDTADDRLAMRGLLFAVTASFVLIVLFSFSDRKADRFIFPAYYFMAAAGGVVAIRSSPALSRAVDRLDRPWVPAAFWIGLFLLRLATGSHLPQFTFWRA